MSFWPFRNGCVRALASGTLAFLLARPVFGLAHELIVVAFVALLRDISGAEFWSVIVTRLPLDPVYTLALIRFAGDIQTHGVAVANPLGEPLHVLLPSLFLTPALAAGVWTSAVLEPGSTVLARVLVEFGADVTLLTLSLTLFVVGLRRRRTWLAVWGGLQQAHLALYQFLDTRLSLRDLEAAGLPFAVSSLVSDPSQRAPWFTNSLAELQGPVLSLAAGGLLLVVAYLLAAVLVSAPLLKRVVRRQVQPLRASVGAPGPAGHRATATWLLLVTVGLVVTPLGAFAEVDTRVLEDDDSVAAVAAGGTAFPAIGQPVQAYGPTKVEFAGGQYDYVLLVDGRPEIVRGMGYNVEYSSLDSTERARRYERDFRQMRQIGVNMIFGWFQDQFTGETLALANRYGLGVGMPFELNQDLDYDDPAVRARLSTDVLTYVARHKDDPAVRFWTPGNEVIHRLIFPSWLKRERDQAKEARADSFARFYVELIDQIHALDPNHPVIYRDAEEVYLARIRDAVKRDGVPRPWFAYGTNVYSRRLGEILEGWPNQGLDAPLFVSEFAPGGTGPDDRPRGLRNIWATIRSYPRWVVGGAVYTWSTDGPEELDKVFGLVDADGRPRDGALAAMAEIYSREGALATPDPRVAHEYAN